MSAAAAAAAQKAANEFYTEDFTLFGIGSLFIVLRTISRIMSVGVKKFQLDDYLMLFAWVLYGLESGAAYIVGAWFHGLANNGMTPEQRMSITPDNPEYHLRIGGSKVQVIGWNIYSLLLWTLKLCVCVFYARLTTGLGDKMQLRIRIGYGLIVGTYVATMLSIMLACRPLSKNWQISPDPGNVCQPAISRVNCLVVVILNVLTDLYLMSIPLPLLYKAQLPLKRKILLIAMFSGGFFVIACAILRCSLILIDPVTGAQAAGSWAVRETFVAVIIGNLPMVYKLFRLATKDGVDRIKERTERSRNGRVALSDDDGLNGKGGFFSTGGNSGMNSRVSKKSRFIHPLSMRNATTMSESQEELHMDTIKEHGCIVTSEVSVQEQEQRNAPRMPASNPYSISGFQSARERGDDNYIYAGPEEKRTKFVTSTVEDAESSSNGSGYRSPR